MSRTKKISDDEVLALAFPVICREGFDSFTLEQVSRVTGLSPATLLQRFKSKQRLAFLARDHRWRQNLSQFDPSPEHAGPTGLAGILALLRDIAASVDSVRLNEHLRLLAEDMTDPALKAQAASFFDWTRKTLETFIIQAIQSGELQTPIPARDLAWAIEAMIQGSIFQFGFLEDREIHAWIHRQVGFVLRPYLTPEADFELSPASNPR